MPELSFGERVVQQAYRLAPQRALSELIGWGARASLPAPLRTAIIGAFARRFDIDIAEAEKPLAAYSGVEEFFTRRLRPGARPLPADPDIVVSPADGTTVIAGRVEQGTLLEAKDARFSLTQLLADPEAAARLEGGSYVITYLSPRDYHRVHAPVAGRIVASAHIPGELFPVNDASLKREPGLFARNERFVTFLEGPAGFCAVAMIAAIGVGHITASYDPSINTHEKVVGEVTRKRYQGTPELARGDELGIFHLGSTTVVVFERDRVALDDLTPGSKSRMGQPIGRLRAAGHPTP